ncbi:hypothetical protein [Halarcobacter sp.]|uniref:hypothetical protein n=1 Tax=Halarcobacter sp. TaxID=2321133 RepID=UPI0029F46FAD|nr:hypothetical protein [Halarcobacter sp.]
MKRTQLEIAKLVKLQEVSKKYKDILNSKPKVFVKSLNIYVDGGRENKDDFKSKWELMQENETTTVKDAENDFHPNITKTQMKDIWAAIVINGEAVLNEKWIKEKSINQIFIENYKSEDEAIAAVKAIEI